jgi:hypothetical protein
MSGKRKEKKAQTGRVPMEHVLRLAKSGHHGDRKKKLNKSACRGKVKW